MSYDKFVGKNVEVLFLDHEQETGVEEKLCLVEKSLEVVLFGKFLGETKNYIVIAPWVCEDGNDIYRILKCCINGIKVLKQ
jgi:hypothetical protein